MTDLESYMHFTVDCICKRYHQLDDDYMNGSCDLDSLLRYAHLHGFYDSVLGYIAEKYPQVYTQHFAW